MKEKRYIPIVLLLCVLAGVVIHYGDLRNPGLQSGDEALTALRARGLAEHGHYWTPYWNGGINLHKPPFYYWFVAWGYQVFGIGMLAVRLPSVLAFLGLLIVIYVLGRDLLSAWAGLLASVLLALHPTVLTQSRLGMMDTTVMLLFMLSCYFLWKAFEHPRAYYGWGLCCGLALLTKGGGAILCIPVSLVYLLLANRKAFRTPAFYGGLLVAVVLPGIWFVSQYVMHKDEFLRTYYAREVRYRLEHNMWESFLEQRTTRRLWLSWGGLAPLAFASPVILLCMAKTKALARQWRKLLFAYSLLVVGMLLTSLIRQQMYWYIMPAVVSMALIMGVLLGLAFSGQAPRWVIPVICLLLLLGTFLPDVYASKQIALTVSIIGLSGGLLAFLPARTDLVAKATVQVAMVLAIIGGMFVGNRAVNLSLLAVPDAFQELARQIPSRELNDNWLIVNFRHYPMNCLTFYTGRDGIQLRRFARWEVQPHEAYYGIIEGEGYEDFLRGLEVTKYGGRDAFTLIVVSNATDQAIMPERMSATEGSSM